MNATNTTRKPLTTFQKELLFGRFLVTVALAPITLPVRKLAGATAKRAGALKKKLAG
jgi:hypothetical protein